MKRMALTLFAVVLASGAAPTAAAQLGKVPPPQLVVSAAAANATHIDIEGVNFGSSPSVFLGGTPLEGVTVNGSGTHIMALNPGFAPATYLLHVSSGNSTTQNGTFDLTIGAAGPQGSAGATGPQGPQGVVGLQGTQGEIGPAAPTGPQGVQGVQGEPGPEGATGVQGDPGSPGSQGDPGTPGATGPEGPSGPQGLQGAQGSQGPEGPAGPGSSAESFLLEGFRPIALANGVVYNQWVVTATVPAGSPAGLLVATGMHQVNLEHVVGTNDSGFLFWAPPVQCGTSKSFLSPFLVTAPLPAAFNYKMTVATHSTCAIGAGGGTFFFTLRSQMITGATASDTVGNDIVTVEFHTHP